MMGVTSTFQETGPDDKDTYPRSVQAHVRRDDILRKLRRRNCSIETQYEFDMTKEPEDNVEVPPKPLLGLPLCRSPPPSDVIPTAPERGTLDDGNYVDWNEAVLLDDGKSYYVGENRHTQVWLDCTMEDSAVDTI
jgi:hypothetical protein